MIKVLLEEMVPRVCLENLVHQDLQEFVDCQETLENQVHKGSKVGRDLMGRKVRLD